jgi:hypothetical protein
VSDITENVFGIRKRPRNYIKIHLLLALIPNQSHLRERNGERKVRSGDKATFLACREDDIVGFHGGYGNNCLL